MASKVACKKCQTLIDPEFPLHMCRPAPNVEEILSGTPEEKAAKQVLQETGHASMLHRVRAAYKMLTSMQDDWDKFVELGNVARPKYVRGIGDVKFLESMYLLFDSVQLENVALSKQQFFYISDLYARSL